MMNAMANRPRSRLLDEKRYLCSERTMYRILAANDEARERRAIRSRKAPSRTGTGGKQVPPPPLRISSADLGHSGFQQAFRSWLTARSV
jgi:hypothetical protein